MHSKKRSKLWFLLWLVVVAGSTMLVSHQHHRTTAFTDKHPQSFPHRDEEHALRQRYRARSTTRLAVHSQPATVNAQALRIEMVRYGLQNPRRIHRGDANLQSQNLMATLRRGICPNNTVYNETQTLGPILMCHFSVGHPLGKPTADVEQVGRCLSICSLMPSIVNYVHSAAASAGGKSALFVDVGAGVGLCSLYVALVYPPGMNNSEPLSPRVIATEPISDNFQLLRYNTGLNILNKRVCLFHVAVSASDSVHQALAIDNGVASYTRSGSERAPIAQLSQVVEETVDVMRINCIGCHMDVLRGLRHPVNVLCIVAELRQMIVASRGRKHEFRTVVEALHAADYRSYALDLRRKSVDELLSADANLKWGSVGLFIVAVQRSVPFHPDQLFTADV